MIAKPDAVERKDRRFTAPIVSSGCWCATTKARSQVKRWMYITAIVAIATLLVSSQCYALCLRAASRAVAGEHSDHCQQSSHSQPERGDTCHHRATDVTGVEAVSDLANFSIALVQIDPYLSPHRLLPLEENRLVNSRWFRSDSPPGTPLFLSFSVLRI